MNFPVFRTHNVLLLLLPLIFCFNDHRPPPPEPQVIEELDIARVWPGHPVGFELLTKGDDQYVAYYDQDRNMTVAHRKLGQKNWVYKILPSRVGWDSHNYIAIALDSDNHLHVSGNMHVNKLVYFYASQPNDVTSLQQVESMTGKDETRVTYPIFSKGPNGEMIFTYRDGSSGSGNQVYNVYDTKTKTWRRLLDSPLINGEGEMNAYINGPVAGPDGYFHMIWVWRDTPDASTNHDLTYARSKDLRHWERSDGSPLQLPITIAKAEIVDPVPAKGGMINGNTVMGFDADKKLVITYHKYDAKGNTQIYNARREKYDWRIVQATDWNFRWDFGGGGSLTAEVGVNPIKVDRSGKMTMAYSSKGAGDGIIELDPKSLKPIRKLPLPATIPAALSKTQDRFPGVIVNFKEDEGRAAVSGTRYILRWETLGRNRDQPRTGAIPEAGVLKLYQVRL